MGGLKIERIDGKGFADIRHIWDEVYGPDNTDIFRLFEWARNWWEAYGHDKELLVLLVKDGDSPIAIAPLVIAKDRFNRLPARKVEFMYRMNFIIRSRKEEVIREVSGYLKSIQRSWDVIDFSDMEHDPETIGIFRQEIESRGFDFLIKDGEPYPYLDVDKPWGEYWPQRKSKFRKNLRHSFRDMEKTGGISANVSIYDHTRTAELKDALEKMFALSLKGWKAKVNAAMGSTRAKRELYRGIADIFSKKGRVEISFLERNGVPIAGTMGIIYKGIFYSLSTDYDKEYARLSPGNILMHELLKEVFSDSILRVEFLKGLFPQKQNWLTGMHKKAHVMVFKRSLKSRALRFSETRLRRWIKGRWSC